MKEWRQSEVKKIRSVQLKGNDGDLLCQLSRFWPASTTDSSATRSALFFRCLLYSPSGPLMDYFIFWVPSFVMDYSSN